MIWEVEKTFYKIFKKQIFFLHWDQYRKHRKNVQIRQSLIFLCTKSFSKCKCWSKFSHNPAPLMRQNLIDLHEEKAFIFWNFYKSFFDHPISSGNFISWPQNVSRTHQSESYFFRSVFYWFWCSRSAGRVNWECGAEHPTQIPWFPSVAGLQKYKRTSWYLVSSKRKT